MSNIPEALEQVLAVISDRLKESGFEDAGAIVSGAVAWTYDTGGCHFCDFNTKRQGDDLFGHDNGCPVGELLRCYGQVPLASRVVSRPQGGATRIDEVTYEATWSNEPIREDVMRAQVKLGYHWGGYGIHSIKVRKEGEQWVTRWRSFANCD